MEKVLETSTAQSLWETANRTAHEQLLEVLENKKEAVSTANGEVKLNLGSLLTNLAGQVGLGQSLAEQLPPEAGQIRILKSEQLKTAQDIVVAIKGLALLLSILTFLVFGLAIYLTQGGRWVTVLFSGIGLIIAALLVLVLRHVAGGIVVDQLVKQQNIKPAAEAAWGDRHLADGLDRGDGDHRRRLLRGGRLALLADRLGAGDAAGHRAGPPALPPLVLRRPRRDPRHLPADRLRGRAADLPHRRRPRARWRPSACAS